MDVAPSKIKVDESALKAYAKSVGITLNQEQISCLHLTDNPTLNFTVVWMDFYFDMVGDKCPNSYGQIHLESQSKIQVYIEYCAAMDLMKLKPQCLTVFRETWRIHFSHVKIRQYKAVAGNWNFILEFAMKLSAIFIGKCCTCYDLSRLRIKANSSEEKREIGNLHQLHKTAYMGERLAYYMRRAEARQDNKRVWSFIIDGMQQAHSQIPYLGILKHFPDPLKLKLVGVLQHCPNPTMTFQFCYNNVESGVNLNIYCLLLELERNMIAKGFLSECLYIQIDGASDNTAKGM